MKALGRCDQKHHQVVEYEGRVPSGTCTVCKRALTEWAVKWPTGGVK